MSTPASTTSDDQQGKPELEQITFRFCSECSNMLYPKEDEETHRLQFTCRTCHYTEQATSTCVFRHVMNSAAGETAGVTQDVGSDPTVGNFSFGTRWTEGGRMGKWEEYGPTFIPEVCLCCGETLRCDQCGQSSDYFAVDAVPVAAHRHPEHSHMNNGVEEEARLCRAGFRLDLTDMGLALDQPELQPRCTAPSLRELLPLAEDPFACYDEEPEASSPITTDSPTFEPMDVMVTTPS